jgi:hypothetical protein
MVLLLPAIDINYTPQRLALHVLADALKDTNRAVALPPLSCVEGNMQKSSHPCHLAISRIGVQGEGHNAPLWFFGVVFCPRAIAFPGELPPLTDRVVLYCFLPGKYLASS